jgi:hypothetical protein
VKVLVGAGGSGLLLAGLYAGDALTAGEVYDVPLEQAYGELSAMRVPAALMQVRAGVHAPEVAVRQSFPVIDWHFQLDGRDVATFTARLSPEGPGRTRVRVEYTPGEASAPELIHLTSAGLVRDLARLTMSEQIDAQLERRPVDDDRAIEALARHAAAHPKQIREFEQAMGEMAAGLYRQANETARDAAPAASRASPPVDAPAPAYASGTPNP